MAERIPWDEHEEAVLLCALIKVLNQERAKKAVVSEVSGQLRDYALARGIAIDEKFRNKNGINLQMSCLEYVFTNGKSGLHAESGWYFTIMQIYNHDRERYLKLLAEFNEVFEPYKKKKNNFYNWLKNNKARADDILIFINDMTIHLLRTKTIKKSILEITEIKEIESLLRKISLDYYLYSRQVNEYRTALGAYKEYLQFLQEDVGESKNEKAPEEKKEEHPQAPTVIEGGNKKNNNLSFYDWLMQTCGVSKKTAGSYASAIVTANTFAKARQIDHDMLAIRDVNTVSKTIDALFQIQEFVELDKRQHRRFHAALRRYLQYLSGVAQPKNVDPIPYQKILLEKFPKGFRIESGIDMRRFRNYWEGKYGSALTADDATVRNNMGHFTIRYKDFVYLPEMMASSVTRQELFTYLSVCFRSVNAVSIVALYEKFKTNFANSQISNDEMLKSYLSFVNDGSFFIQGNYLTADAKTVVNPGEEIKEYLKNAGVPITVGALQAALSHISANTVSRIVTGQGSSEFVWNRRGEYFHADSIDFSHEETDTITALIQQAIDDTMYMGGKELTDAIKVKLPAILEKYPFLTDNGLLGAVAYKLQSAFSFKGKIISAYGRQLSMPDLFAHFASTRDHFTLADLNSLKQALGVSIPFDSVYANSLRISKNDFVSRKQASFNTEAIDAVISLFCSGDYIAIKEINFFASFPYAGFPWNEFLLEHYVAAFSQKFKLLHVGGFRESSVAGAIVRQDSHINEFDELISTALADSVIPLNREEALRYLVDIGLLARARYSEIEQALGRAEKQRLSKG